MPLPGADPPRQTCAEQRPQLVAHAARRSVPLPARRPDSGLTLGGRPGARFAARRAITVSRMTLLMTLRRLVRVLPEPPVAAPPVRGGDDVAVRPRRHGVGAPGPARSRRMAGRGGGTAGPTSTPPAITPASRLVGAAAGQRPGASAAGDAGPASGGRTGGRVSAGRHRGVPAVWCARDDAAHDDGLHAATGSGVPELRVRGDPAARPASDRGSPHPCLECGARRRAGNQDQGDQAPEGWSRQVRPAAHARR